MEKTFVQALKLAIENKGNSYSYTSYEKREGWVHYSKQMEKAIFISYGIVQSFTEREAKRYIKERSKQ